MKFKSLRKLALSGVALAAAATTLGTSTFAWYVTNSKATVEGVQGIAKAGGLGNVLVAQAATENAVNGHGAFAQDITLNTGNITQTTSTAGLIPALPVTALNATTATSVTGATKIDSTTKWVDTKGAEITTGVKYIQFDLWILSTDATTVNFSYTVENTTPSTALVNQIAYAASGLPTGVSQGNTFNVNIIDALRMSYTQDDSASSVILDVKGSAASASYGSASGTVTSSNFKTGGDANAYYTAVLGDSDIVTASTTALSQTSSAITVTANTESKLSFYIWLEGSDADCFDSCSGQSFVFHFAFETSNQNNQQQNP